MNKYKKLIVLIKKTITKWVRGSISIDKKKVGTKYGTAKRVD